jgi:uncharacterized protein (DUF433 family)
MGPFDKLAVDPTHLNGEPYLRGTRLSVSRVVWLSDQSLSWEALIEDFPELDDVAIRQAYEYAQANDQAIRSAA